MYVTITTDLNNSNDYDNFTDLNTIYVYNISTNNCKKSKKS